MQHKEQDAAYLWDMLDAAKTVTKFTAGLKFHQYERDRKRQLAVERAIEIIGEAANRVSKDFQHSHPNIPWKGLIGQRNVLPHDYGDIKQERMWVVAAGHIPELVAMLEPLIPPEPKTN